MDEDSRWSSSAKIRIRNDFKIIYLNHVNVVLKYLHIIHVVGSEGYESLIEHTRITSYYKKYSFKFILHLLYHAGNGTLDSISKKKYYSYEKYTIKADFFLNVKLFRSN